MSTPLATLLALCNSSFDLVILQGIPSHKITISIYILHDFTD